MATHNLATNAPDWLTARPIAHRGLHDASRGIIENTIEAAQAAVERGFSIECDVQPSADGEPIVFHDDTLDRLTQSSGAVKDRSARELASAAFRALRAGEAKIPTFRQLLNAVGGKAPIICEIKSEFDGDMRLAEAVARLGGAYTGPLAFKSFDPAVIAHLRGRAVARPLGIVAEADYSGKDWRALSSEERVACANFLHYSETRPDFLSFSVDDLPHPTPFLLRTILATPILAWTVRLAAQREKAARWADQIIFEGDLAL